MARQTPEREFQNLKKEVNSLQFHYDVERHKMKMEELSFQRESDEMHHQREMERQRIKSAEIRKDREMRMAGR